MSYEQIHTYLKKDTRPVQTHGIDHFRQRGSSYKSETLYRDTVQAASIIVP